MYLLSYTALFLLVELLYFRIAIVNKIIDSPNERSSHSKVTIRGGGIVFPLSVLAWIVFGKYYDNLYFVAGLLLVSGISFLDDIRNLDSKVRFFVHILSVNLLLLPIESLPWYFFIVIAVILVAFINAYNFMDGINGITGCYSLIAIGTLWWVDYYFTDFIDDSLFPFLISGLLVFSFFNFRTKAVCFAGDVGSVSMAFVISFLIIQVIIHTGNFLFIGFVILYGLDAASTIIFRLVRKENVLHAHRSHFYQFLCNEKKWPHLLVSSLYSLTQLVINVILITSNYDEGIESFLMLILLVLILTTLFITLRFFIEGKDRLLTSLNS